MKHFQVIFWSHDGEADLPSAQQAPDQDTWIPDADGDEVGPRGPQPSPEEGTQAAHGEAAVEVRGRLTEDRRVASPQWLTHAADFEAVRREGKRVRTSALEVRTIASLRRQDRVGLIVPRHQHSAVDRNRLKRRLRELVRRLWAAPGESGASAPGTARDHVVRATPAAYRASFSALREDISRLRARVEERST